MMNNTLRAAILNASDLIKDLDASRATQIRAAVNAASPDIDAIRGMLRLTGDAFIDGIIQIALDAIDADVLETWTDRSGVVQSWTRADERAERLAARDARHCASA